MTFKSELTLCNENVKISTHSDGAVSISIPQYFASNWQNTNNWVLYANIKDPAGALALIYLLDHLDTDPSYRDIKVSLDLTYFPNARQDRVTGNDEYETPNTVKTYSKLLQSFNCLSVVYASDIHSNVPSILVDKLTEQDHKQSFICTVPFEIIDELDYFVSPDLGAYKKVKSVADNYELPYLVAQKTRNPTTHEIELSLTTKVDLTDKTVMICDDIIDYGTSVNELVKTLREKYKVGKVYVYATHGILPMNYRLEIPSRFSFVAEGVEKLLVCYLWKDEQNTDIPENVQFFDQF